jgi:hypothetical protein
MMMRHALSYKLFTRVIYSRRNLSCSYYFRGKRYKNIAEFTAVPTFSKVKIPQ